MSLGRPREIIGAVALAVTVASGSHAQQPAPVLPAAPVAEISCGSGGCSATRANCFGKWRAWHDAAWRDGSIDLPLGTTVYAPFEIQIANAQTASMALYHYDFFDGTAELSPRGRDRLHQILCLLPTCFAPVVIERTIWTPELDAARRMMVYNEIAQAGFPLPLERVMVGVPAPIGFKGIEADIVFRNMLIQMQTGGVTRGSGTSGPAGAGFGAAGGGSGLAPISH